MSIASEYKNRVDAAKLEPKGFKNTNHTTAAAVTKDGNCFFSINLLDQNEVIGLADWIYETFLDKNLVSKKRKSK